MIRFYSNVGHSPAWPLVMPAMMALEGAGLVFQPSVAPAYSDAALVAFGDGAKPLGFLIYRHDDVQCSWFVMLAYVDPAHRRQGIHSSLFSALVDRAKHRGDILSIHCGTHIDNFAAQSAFEKHGRAKTAIMYSFPIKDWLDGEAPVPEEDMPIPDCARPHQRAG